MSKITIQKKETSFIQKLNTKRIEFIKLFISRIIINSCKYLRGLNGVNNYNNADDLEDFSPVILEKDDDKHSTTIKYAIDNPNIQNLALTGPYGSGKSSILKTFENNYLQYNYLNISLATFDEKTLDTENH
jgi:ABC-type molybdenum transport system ATPase subunit/photorepair protein PhrA